MNQSDGFLLERIESKKAEKEMTVRDCFGSTLDIDFYYRHPRNYSRRAVFSIDEPAPTIRGVNRPIPQGYPGHPNDACPIENCTRSLTTLERALVQTFPSDYKWIGSKTDMEQMIGNAVPVKLAESIADALASFISATDGTQFYVVTDVIDYTDFKEWLSENQTLSDRGRSDVISRLKRALSICEADGFPDSFYRFQLEQSQNFKCLSSSVRSQIKKAVSLYSDYYTEKYGELKLAI